MIIHRARRRQGIVTNALVLVGLLCGAVPGAQAAAQPISNGGTPRWHDVSYVLPNANWQLVMPDPDAKQAGKRLVWDDREPLHSIELVLNTVNAPAALAPSEVASKYLAEHKAETRPDGVFSDFKTGTRAINGVGYPTFSVHFTPTAGPPVTDENEVLVFPADYDVRQRWFVVQWADTHSATTGPKALDELDSFISSLAFTPIGSLLVSDDFSDPLNGALGGFQSSEHYDVAYTEGELAIFKNDPASDSIYVMPLPGTYADTALAADVHVTGTDFGSVEHLFCRRTNDGAYRIDLDQSDGSARLLRTGTSSDATEELVSWTFSPAIKLGPASNHLELVCAGTSIELSVNGTRVLSAHDSMFSEGRSGLEVGGFADADAIDEVRFANVVLTQR